MGKSPFSQFRFATDDQLHAWERLQKSALRFSAGFLDRGMRTDGAKEAFFWDAMAFVRAMAPPVTRAKRKVQR